MMNILDDINNTDLSIRCVNTLRANGVNTILQLLKLSDEQLNSMRVIGKRTIREIKEVQDEYLTHKGVRYYISDEEPVNDDMVLTFRYGIWKFMKAPCPMPYWGNAKECVKLVIK